MDRRLRRRRDEALHPGAVRKWQEARRGARVAVDGCRRSDGADDATGGQTLI